MSVVISTNLVLAEDEIALSLTAEHPIIGYRNVVTPSNISAASEAADYPATNLANPATHLVWRGQFVFLNYVQVDTGTTDLIDYVAFAKHNFWSQQIAVAVYGETTPGAGYVLLCPEVILPNDGPAIFRFTPQQLSSIRIGMAEGDAEPQMAVVYVGKLLVLMRKLYVGVTPLPRGRIAKVTHGQAESGQYLGSVQVGAYTKSQVPLTLLDPDWAREYLDPFLATKGTPFFIATRPESYPLECGYAWLTNDPMPVPTAPSNLDACMLEMTGVT